MWKQAGRLSSIGLEMGVAVTIGILGGKYLDGRFDTKPLFFWIGLAVGFGAAVKAVYDGVRIARRSMDSDDDASTRKKV